MASNFSRCRAWVESDVREYFCPTFSGCDVKMITYVRKMSVVNVNVWLGVTIFSWHFKQLTLLEVKRRCWRL